MLSRIKYKLIFMTSELDYLFYKKITKRINAVKFALKNKDNYCSWDVYNSSVELLFSQFKDFYEMHEEKFSDEMLINLYSELDYFKKVKMDKSIISNTKNQIKKDEKAFVEIRNIYRYIAYSRIQNEQKFQEILDKHIGISTPFSLKASKEFKVTWKFDNAGLADVYYEECSSISNDLFDFEDACNDKDTEVAKRILDLRSYLID